MMQREGPWKKRQLQNQEFFGADTATTIRLIQLGKDKLSDHAKQPTLSC
jgi:hypothetical protein